MNLTPQERRVLETSFRFGRVRRVAIELDLAEQTVKNRRCTAFKKLGVHSLIEAAQKLGVMP